MQEGAARELREKSSGLIRTIADWAYDTSVREYDELAIAVALAVIATCAQGTYMTPQGRVLSLYQLCILPAAGGKDHYYNCVKNVLRQVDKKICMPEAGSGNGIHSELFAWNSRIMVIDEVQDYLFDLSKTDNPYVGAIVTDLKILANGPDYLPGTSLKRESSPDIITPRMSFFGVGTPEKFKKVVTADNIAGGLLSRFMYWTNEKPPFRVIRPRPPLDPEFIGKLRAIFALGYSYEGAEEGVVDHKKFLDRKKAYHSGTATEHVPQCKPERLLTMNEEAAHEYEVLSTMCQTVYIQNCLAPDAAITDRIPEMALRLASLHALGCERTELNLQDMEWGRGVALLQGKDLCKLARDWMAGNAQEYDRKKIVSFLEKHDGKRSRRDLARSMDTSTRALDGFLSDLESRGQIAVKCPGGGAARGKDGSYDFRSIVHLLADSDD